VTPPAPPQLPSEDLTGTVPEAALPPLPAAGGRASAASPVQWLLIATAAAVVIAAIWLGVRAANPPAVQEPAATPVAPAAATPAASAGTPPTTPAAGATAARPPAEAAPPPVEAAPPPAAAAAAGRFEIVVASFRTEGRADAVAKEVAALGVPIRRRFAGGWEQVLAGPFGSRAQAEAARRQLDDAGFTGTQIISSAL
jgi:cell division protein FtsN